MSGYLVYTVPLSVLWALIGGAWYRVRGGGLNLPRIVNLTVWALLLTVPIWWLTPWWAAAFVVAFVATITALGHGDFIDGGSGTKGDPDEIWAPVADFLTGQRDGQLHDAVGMAVSGVSYTVIPAVASVVWSDPFWLLWAPVGALKGAAYWIGWQTPWKNVLGEFLTGFFLCGTIALLAHAWVFII